MSLVKKVMQFVLKALANPKLTTLAQHCDYVIAFVGEQQESVGVYVGIVKAKGSNFEEDASVMASFIEELGKMFPEGKIIPSKDPEPKPVFMLPVNVLEAKFNVSGQG
jgi:hypothetical protein